MAIPEVVTVSAARQGLSGLLAALSAADAEAAPVLIGAHRGPQAVLLSVAAYEILLDSSVRRAAVASATGSLAAEGLHVTPAAENDALEYVRGGIGPEEMLARAVARHRVSEDDAAG